VHEDLRQFCRVPPVCLLALGQQGDCFGQVTVPGHTQSLSVSLPWSPTCPRISGVTENGLLRTLMSKSARKKRDTGPVLPGVEQTILQSSSPLVEAAEHHRSPAGRLPGRDHLSVALGHISDEPDTRHKTWTFYPCFT
jgi:hypothetical protein